MMPFVVMEYPGQHLIIKSQFGRHSTQSIPRLLYSFPQLTETTHLATPPPAIALATSSISLRGISFANDLFINSLQLTVRNTKQKDTYVIAFETDPWRSSFYMATTFPPKSFFKILQPTKCMPSPFNRFLPNVLILFLFVFAIFCLLLSFFLFRLSYSIICTSRIPSNIFQYSIIARIHQRLRGPRTHDKIRDLADLPLLS